ncbi:MAG TPA: hypothetical protein VGH80_06055 [Xanthomonadaceae bacterium]|jgi:hypothetical protein
MALYAACDLHSNNTVLAVIDEAGTERWCTNARHNRCRPCRRSGSSTSGHRHRVRAGLGTCVRVCDAALVQELRRVPGDFDQAMKVCLASVAKG